MKKKSKKGGKSGGRGDVINIGKDDWKGGKKKFPTAPGGKYRIKFGKKSKIKPNARGDGNVLNLVSTITALHNGKKTPHKGVNVFDNIAPHVGWKIAQILKAMGMKKPPKKKLTLKDLLALILKYNKEVRAVIGIDRYQGAKKNNISMYLPLSASKDEDDDDIEEDDDDLDDEEDQDEDDDSEDEDDDDSEDEDDDLEDDDEDDEEDEEDEDDDDDDEDDEDDDDDEDEDEEDDDDDDDDRPKSKKSKSKSKSKKRKTRR